MSTKPMNKINQPQTSREKLHDPKSIIIGAALAAVLVTILLLGLGPILFPPQASEEQTRSINDLEYYIFAVQLDAEFDTSRTQLLRYDDTEKSGCSNGRAPDIEGYTLVDWTIEVASLFAEDAGLDQNGIEPYNENGQRRAIFIAHYVNTALYEGSIDNMSYELRYVNAVTGDLLMPPLSQTGFNHGDSVTIIAPHFSGFACECNTITIYLTIDPGDPQPYLCRYTVQYAPIENAPLS